MRLRNSFVFGLGLATTLALAIGGPRLGAQAGKYTQVGDIQIGGPQAASWDYLNVDGANKKLYVSHGIEFVVIDLTTEKVIGRIADTAGAHGAAFAPNGKSFVTAGRGNMVVVADSKTLKTLGKVDTGANPDAIAFEPKMKEIYAFNHTGHSTTVINPDTLAVVATIELSGDVETGQADPGLGRMFVNIEDKNEVAVIDVAAHKVVATWPVAPGSGPTGMAIDTASHRLIIGAGSVMVLMDATNGKVVSTVPICSGTDASAFDPATKLAFASCRDGKITVAHMDSPDKLTVVDTITTAQGSKTMTLDPATHKLYIGGAKPMAAQPAAAGGGRAARPQMDPESFHVFIFGMGK
jgi:DNA-binding beta-propeller fold protein YncE